MRIASVIITALLALVIASPAQATTVHTDTARHTLSKSITGSPCFQETHRATHQARYAHGTRVRSVQLTHRQNCDNVDQTVTHRKVHITVFRRSDGHIMCNRYYSTWADHAWRWIGCGTRSASGLRVRVAETVHRSFCDCDRVVITDTRLRWRGGE